MANQTIGIAYDASQLSAGAQAAIAAFTGQKNAVNQVADAMATFNSRGQQTGTVIKGLTADGAGWTARLKQVGGQLQLVSGSIRETANSASLLSGAFNSLRGFNVPTVAAGFGLASTLGEDIGAGIERALTLEKTLAQIDIVSNKAIGGLDAAMQRLGQTSLVQLQQRTNELKNSFTTLGETVNRFVIAPAITNVNALVKAVGGLKEGLANLVLGDLGKNATPTLGEYRQQQVEGVAAEQHVEVNDAAKAFLAAAQSPAAKDVASQVQVVTAAINLGKQGFGDYAQAARLVTKELETFGKTASDSGHVADVLFQIMKDGSLAPDQIAAAMTKLNPIARQLGLSLEETAAVFTAMTRDGSTAEEASRLLELGLTRMLKPTTQLQQEMNKFGIASLKTEVAANGLGRVIDFISDQAKKGGDVLGEEFGIRSAKGVSALADSAEVFKKELELMQGDIKNLPSLPVQDLNNRFKDTANTAQQVLIQINNIKAANAKNLFETASSAKLASSISDIGRAASQARSEVEKARKSIEDIQAAAGTRAFNINLQYASGGYLGAGGNIESDQQSVLLQQRINDLRKQAKELSSSDNKDKFAEGQKLYAELEKLETQLFQHKQANAQKIFDYQVKTGQQQASGYDVNGNPIFQRFVNTTELSDKLKKNDQDRIAALESYAKKQEQIYQDAKALSDDIGKALAAPKKLFDEQGEVRKNIKDLPTSLAEVNKQIDDALSKLGKVPGFSPETTLQLRTELTKLKEELNVQGQANIAGKQVSGDLGAAEARRRELLKDSALDLDTVKKSFGDIKKDAPNVLDALQSAFDPKNNNLQRMVDLLQQAATLLPQVNGGAPAAGPAENPAEGELYGGRPKKPRLLNEGGMPKYLWGGGPAYMDEGGYPVSWVPRGSDQIPAMLGKDEMVMNAAATKAFAPLLQAMNNNLVPRTVGQGGNVTNVGDINVNVQGQPMPQQTIQEIGNALRRQIQRGLLSLHG